MKTTKEISDYRHKLADPEPQTADPRPGNYYVSVFDRSSNAGHGRTGLLLGPFPRHELALKHVQAATNKANEVCRDSIWYSFGTVRMADDYRKPGTLNRLLPDLLFFPEIV